MMTFTFPRVSAGIYEVQKNSEIVGFIRKSTATKWIVTDIIDTPQQVTKTLKDAKDACINLIIFESIDNNSVDVYNDSVGVDKVNPKLNKVLEGSLHTYKFNSETKKLEEVSPKEFGFAEPTLQPIQF